MTDYQKAITDLKKQMEQAKDLQQLIEIKNKWIKETVFPLQLEIKNATPENKKTLGAAVGLLKQQAEDLFLEMRLTFEAKVFQKLNYDLSMSNENLQPLQGHWLNDILKITIKWFEKMNFVIEQGNEIVSHEENFDWLNIGVNHVARLNSDSFYFDDKKMLRTHNTANTARILKNQNPKKDLRGVTFGNVFRNDPDDATHTHQFMQIDFIWVQKDLSVSNLKWIIDNFLSFVFEIKLQTRYRLSFFPFTEPSFEVDVACPKCQSQGCEVCKKTGWIEILGCGMLHENVLKNTGYDPTNYNAAAAGIGVERLAMIKHLITDIRHFYNNDKRFFKKG